jgi:hypothetical protein
MRRYLIAAAAGLVLSATLPLAGDRARADDAWQQGPKQQQQQGAAGQRGQGGRAGATGAAGAAGTRSLATGGSGAAGPRSLAAGRSRATGAWPVGPTAGGPCTTGTRPVECSGAVARLVSSGRARQIIITTRVIGSRRRRVALRARRHRASHERAATGDAWAREQQSHE